MSIDIWNAISAIAAALQTIVVIIALLYAIAQLREAARARATEAMRQVFEVLSSPKAQHERRVVYQSTGADFSRVPEEELQVLWNVAISFNNVGLLISRGFLPAEVAYDIYGDAAVRCWQVLEPLLRQERQRRGERDTSPYYLKYFEKMADNSEEYLKKHYPTYRRLTYGAGANNTENAQVDSTNKQQSLQENAA